MIYRIYGKSVFFLLLARRNVAFPALALSMVDNDGGSSDNVSCILCSWFSCIAVRCDCLFACLLGVFCGGRGAGVRCIQVLLWNLPSVR